MNSHLKIPPQFKKRKDFSLNLDQSTIRHINPNYYFSIMPSGYIPKSGLLLRDYLLKNIERTNTALEIGVGELAFIPISLVKHNKIQHIDALEIDDSAIKLARKNILNNNLADKIIIYKDWSNVSNNKYDLIYSNPPQMPVRTNKSLHDDGGKYGLQIIEKIINYAKNHLRKDGTLVLLVFDFLNIERSYNGGKTLIDILKSSGLNGKIKKRFKIKIRPGGKTEKQLAWIKKQYPLFNFEKGNTLGHSMLIVEAKYIGNRQHRKRTAIV